MRKVKGKTRKDDVSKGKKNEGGLKYDSNKPPLSLIPGSGLRAIGEVLAYGKEKYNAHNWRKGIEHSRLLDAAMRHLSYVCDGDLLDKESGLRHLAHAATNLVFLLDMQENHPELDDLYKNDSIEIKVTKYGQLKTPPMPHGKSNPEDS